MPRSPRRPSAALVVAFIALLVALGGSAGADPIGSIAKAIKGKTIKKGSVPGNRLKGNSITGRQVRESTLRTVPKAKAADRASAADSAATATTAQSAVSATSATTAGTAASAELARALDGHQRMSTKRAAPTAGATEAAARDAAPRVPLGTSGPFTVYGKCFRDDATATTHAEAFLETTVDGVLLASYGPTLAGPAYLNGATPEVDRRIMERTVTADQARISAYPFIAIPPSGPAFAGAVSLAARQGNAGTGGAFGEGDACLFVGLTETG